MSQSLEQGPGISLFRAKRRPRILLFASKGLYRIESIAFAAGYTPKKHPTANANRRESHRCERNGRGNVRHDSGRPQIRQPQAEPRMPPNTLITTASIRNWMSMSRRLAPIALRTPISRSPLGNRHKHDVHDAYAPTTREIAAIPPIAADNTLKIRLIAASMSSWVITVKSTTP